jgi:hypothetical protein
MSQIVMLNIYCGRKLNLLISTELLNVKSSLYVILYIRNTLMNLVEKLKV